MVTELNSSNFDNEIKKGVSIVDMYADWCGPCKRLSPIIEDLSKEVKRVKFVKLNVDDSEEIASRYRIMSIPTIILFKDGSEVGRVIGLLDKEALRNKFKEILGKLFV